MTFDKFWAAYPIKNNKKKCRIKWQERNLDVQFDQIMDSLQNMLKLDKLWSIGIGIPYPYTYINGDRWEDEPDIEVEREQQLRVPRDDTQLTSFAQQNGLPSPGSGQSYVEYRRNLERHIANSGVH